MAPTRTISNSVGRMLKVVKRIRKSMPCVPRSMTRLDTARLPLEMEPQRQCMEMAEHFEGEVTDRPLGDRREDGVADFAERLRQHAGEAVGDDQGDRHRHRLGGGRSQRIDGVLVEDRHVDVDDLGQHQQHQGNDDADAQRSFHLWATNGGPRIPITPQVREAPIVGGPSVVGRRHERKMPYWATMFGGEGSVGLLSCRAGRSKPLWERDSHEIS